MTFWIASTARSAVWTSYASAPRASARLSRICWLSSHRRIRGRTDAVVAASGAGAPPCPAVGSGRRGGGTFGLGATADGHAIAAQLVVERLGVDAQDAGDPLLVPAVALEGPEDVLALDLVEGGVGLGDEGRGAVPRALGEDRGRKRLPGEHLVLRQHRQAL